MESLRVVCLQYRDGVLDPDPTVIPALSGDKLAQYWPNFKGAEENAELVFKRKLAGANARGWRVEVISPTEFHAWKEYNDGDGTPDRPNRKDRYFRIEKVGDE